MLVSSIILAIPLLLQKICAKYTKFQKYRRSVASATAAGAKKNSLATNTADSDEKKRLIGYYSDNKNYTKAKEW